MSTSNPLEDIVVGEMFAVRKNQRFTTEQATAFVEAFKMYQQTENWDSWFKQISHVLYNDFSYDENFEYFEDFADFLEDQLQSFLETLNVENMLYEGHNFAHSDGLNLTLVGIEPHLMQFVVYLDWDDWMKVGDHFIDLKTVPLTKIKFGKLKGDQVVYKI